MESRLRDLGHGSLVSYSRKVFIPLTRLCREMASSRNLRVVEEI